MKTHAVHLGVIAQNYVLSKNDLREMIRLEMIGNMGEKCRVEKMNGRPEQPVVANKARAASSCKK